MLFAGIDHLHKAGTGGVFGAADAVVSENLHQFPFGVVLDEVGVVSHLTFKAQLLFLLRGADPAVGGHPQLFAQPFLDKERIGLDFPDILFEKLIFLHDDTSFDDLVIDEPKLYRSIRPNQNVFNDPSKQVIRICILGLAGLQ